MARIDSSTSLQELAALVSEALEKAGVRATLSGGGAVSLYSDNEYESRDLDFITSQRNQTIAKALEPLGFRVGRGKKDFTHSETPYFLEFPAGPLAFGEMVVSDEDATILDTPYGAVRIVTATQSVMDRLAAFLHWHDRQALDQAVMVARCQQVDWAALTNWAANEGAAPDLIEKVRTLASAG